MTDREQQILEYIKSNPLISQNELADKLGITRSSVAVHITNLMKKGYIAGKGYIVSDEPYVCVIGGSNVDIQGYTDSMLREKDSNPGRVEISLGGVGRNIAENLSRMEIKTKLISVIGNDVYGEKILNTARRINLDVENVIVSRKSPTSTYLSVMNEKNDMHVAVSHMDAIDELTIEYMESKKYIIRNSTVCVVDTNVSKETLEYILTVNKDKVFFLDTVSITKANKIKDLIGYFHTIKPNKIEAENLTGIKINTNDDLEKVSAYFLDKGVKNVFISLGEEGMYYDDGSNRGIINAKEVAPVSTTGAGDACVAGLVYSYINKMDIKESARFAIGSSIVALSHKDTINPNMSVITVNKVLEEMEIC